MQLEKLKGLNLEQTILAAAKHGHSVVIFD
jgi:hypothetical protein